jgi:light-regulated signal transduction histidine kinase (bacteriophytochrome)
MVKSIAWDEEEIHESRDASTAVSNTGVEQAEGLTEPAEVCAVAQDWPIRPDESGADAEDAPQFQASHDPMGAFTDSVSHHLRAPLRNIIGFAELLRSDAQPPLSQFNLAYLGKVSEAADRMEKLIDALQTFLRLGQAELRRTDVNLNQLVQDVVNLFQARTRVRNISWRIGSLPAVRGDPALLRQALINLISNAVKFTRPRVEARIEIGCSLNGAEETFFFVRDNGVGFDPLYGHKLFGIFNRLHGEREFEGTGIGLANVRNIVHRHGGRTWAEGAVDGGATFYFSIGKQIGPQTCEDLFPFGA